KTQYDLADSAIKLTMEEKDLHKRNKLQSLLLLQMSKFAKEEDFRKLLEDNAMNLDGNLLVKLLEERGEAKAKLETALKMLKKDFSIPQIAELLEQPIEWVENLQQPQTTQPQ
ncbi:MAG: hypothetical protein FWG68_00810, partial [Defluviitaleaceae bacterium]|nr:hypothetical protein [Defluviitaleaceae bacterium]